MKIAALCALLAASTAALAASASAASPAWRALGAVGPTNIEPEGEGTLAVYATNVGSAPSDGSPVTIAVGPIPDGFTIAAPGASGVVGWSCPPEIGEQTVSCTRSTPVPALRTRGVVTVPLAVEPGAPPSAQVPVSVEGGGALPDPEGNDSYLIDLTVSEQEAEPGIAAFWAGAFDENGRSLTQAGAHPAAAATMFLVNTKLNSLGEPAVAGDARDLTVELPPGFVGNPTVTERCPNSLPVTCPPVEATVGVTAPFLKSFGGFSLEGENNAADNTVPPRGYAAQFTTRFIDSKVAALASLRSDEDFGVSIGAVNLPTVYPVFGSYVLIEGNPAAAHGQAFLTNPSGCATEAAISPVTKILSNSWQQPALFDEELVEIPPVTGCDELEFDPAFTFRLSTDQGASPSGATAHLHVDQERLLEPEELAPPHLKKSVVTLPEGMNVNPSAANGLQACSTAQMGYRGGNFPAPNPTRFDEEPVSCPDASKLGTVEVETPLLEDTLHGAVYLASQDDNPFGSLIALYLVVEDAETGIVLKLPGKVTPNEATGQLTAEFDNNPQAPFTDLTLHFRGGGPRSVMSTPDTCGTHTTNGSWTPWSAPESGPPATTIDSLEIAGGCAPTKAQRPFVPGFEAGTTEPLAGAHSPLSVRLTRPDGNKELRGLDMTLPPGLAATLKGVAICSEAALAAGQTKTGRQELASRSCPAASEVAQLTVGAGVGAEPIYVNTGRLYLSGPYKGAPLSLTAVIPAVAGPFDLGVQVIRNAAHVDPVTAQVRIASDPFPAILKGIPLQLRDVRVNVDRPNFALNPTNCEQMAIAGTVRGEGGAVADLSSRFQVGDCARLAFKPRTNVRLFGGIGRGKYQGVRAVVRPRPGDANISGAVVRFPRSAFVAQEHLKDICTRVQYAAEACPKRSVYGKALAYSPLLDHPLTGNVYLRSSDNTLPDLVADLRGPAHQPIRVEVSVRNDSVKGALRNTVQSAPDAPVSYFRLQTFGKAKGLIVNSRNICKGRNQARVAMSAHNGRRSVQKVNVFNKRCKAYKRKLRRAKRKAHRSNQVQRRLTRHRR